MASEPVLPVREVGVRTGVVSESGAKAGERLESDSGTDEAAGLRDGGAPVAPPGPGEGCGPSETGPGAGIGAMEALH